MIDDDRGYARRLIRTARHVEDPSLENNIVYLIMNMADALEGVLEGLDKAEEAK